MARFIIDQPDSRRGGLAATAYASAAPLKPLDAARRWLLRAFGPVSRRLVVDRELRVAALELAVLALWLTEGR